MESGYCPLRLRFAGSSEVSETPASLDARDLDDKARVLFSALLARADAEPTIKLVDPYSLRRY